MFEGIKKVHFIGIGGIGMSGIAEVLISYGYSVRGSDLKKSEITARLKRLGARIYLGHDAANLKDADAVVFSSAVPKDNPEIREALKRNIPLFQRGEMLSEIVRKGFTIAVSGAHGKTTTTALVGSAVKSKKISPTVILGGIFKGLSKNTLLGKGKVFVAEADESDGSFKKIRPNIAVITNMDREHMEYYATDENMDRAYLEFMKGVSFDGLVAVCGDDQRLKKLASSVDRKVVTFGLDPANIVRAKNIETKGFDTSFDLFVADRRLGRARTRLAGIHNVVNSLAAFTVGLEMKLSFGHIAKNLEGFKGVERRMEVKGELEGVTFVDDYAHHPKEIAMTLKAARSVFDGRRFVVLFQPHRYTRLKDLLADFSNSFGDADEVLVTDVYAAGEKPLEGIDSHTLIGLLKQRGAAARYVGDWRKNIDEVRKNLEQGDVVLTMGAGDITRFYSNLRGISGK